MKRELIYLVMALMLVLLLTACLSILPAQIWLDVSTFQDDWSGCSEGLQATLTILGDQTVIESPKITALSEEFSRATNRHYSIHEKIRLEAHCYEPSGVHGQIVIEGNMTNPDPKGGNHRVIHVMLPYDDQSDLDDCIKKNRVYVKIISSQEPFPCVSRHGFQSDAADFE